jgi:hypothetical protein
VKKNEDKVYPLCDFKCPMHESCSWYIDKINKAKNIHWGKEPYDYRKNKCGWYVSMGLDELVQKINNYLNPFNN